MMFSIILKSGQNKLQKIVGLLLCILTTILLTSCVTTKESSSNEKLSSITIHIQDKDKNPVQDFEVWVMEDESPKPSVERGVLIGTTNSEGNVVWEEVRRGKYVIFLPDNQEETFRVDEKGQKIVLTGNKR